MLNKSLDKPTITQHSCAGPARGDLQVCQQLLQHFRVGPSMYQIGHTKIFFRAGVLGQLEDMWARVQRWAHLFCPCPALLKVAFMTWPNCCQQSKNSGRCWMTFCSEK